MNIYATKIGKYYYSCDIEKFFEPSEHFDYDKYTSVNKKYFNEKENSNGIRALIYFIESSYNEDFFWKKFGLNEEILERVRKSQQFLHLNTEDYSMIPEPLAEVFGNEYVKLIRNLHIEYEKYFVDVNRQALKIFDQSKIALRRLSLNNPHIILKHDLKEHAKYIYKIGRFSFLKVNYSNEDATNGLITSYDRCLSNISAKDVIRDCVSSRFGLAGSILSMDYNAFQPRIIFSLAGYNADYENDFYESVNESSGLNLKRDEIKLNFFRMMYGGTYTSTLVKNKFSNIYDLEMKLKADLRKLNYVRSITGRRRSFSSEEKNIDTKLLNSYIQMTHSDVVLEQLVKLDNFLLDKRSKLIGLIADNFIIDCHNDEKIDIIDFCEQNLQSSQYLKNCFLKLRFYNGARWSLLEPIETDSENIY